MNRNRTDINQAMSQTFPILTTLAAELTEQFPDLNRPRAINAVHPIEPRWVHYLVERMESEALEPTQLIIAVIITFVSGLYWPDVYRAVGPILAGYNASRSGPWSSGPVGQRRFVRQPIGVGFGYASGPMNLRSVYEGGYTSEHYGYGPRPMRPGQQSTWFDLPPSTRPPIYPEFEPYSPPENAYEDHMGGHPTNEDFDRIYSRENQRTTPEAFEERLKVQRAFNAEVNPHTLLQNDPGFKNLWDELYRHGTAMIVEAASEEIGKAWDELNEARTKFESEYTEWAVQHNNQLADQAAMKASVSNRDFITSVTELWNEMREGNRNIMPVDLSLSRHVTGNPDMPSRFQLAIRLDSNFSMLTQPGRLTIALPSLNEEVVNQRGLRMGTAVLMWIEEGHRHLLLLVSACHGDQAGLIHLVDGRAVPGTHEALVEVIQRFRTPVGDAMPTKEEEKGIEKKIAMEEVPDPEDVVWTYNRLTKILNDSVQRGDDPTAIVHMGGLHIPQGTDRGDPWAVALEMDKQFASFTDSQKAVLVSTFPELATDFVLIPLEGKRHVLFLAKEHLDDAHPRLVHLIDAVEPDLLDEEVKVEAWQFLQQQLSQFLPDAEELVKDTSVKTEPVEEDVPPEVKAVAAVEADRIERYSNIVRELDKQCEAVLGSDGNYHPFLAVTTLQELAKMEPHLLDISDRHEVAGWLSRALRASPGRGPAVFLIRDTRNEIPYVVAVPPDEVRVSETFVGSPVLYMNREGNIKKYYGMFALPPDDLMERFEKVFAQELPDSVDKLRVQLSLTGM